MWEQTFIDEEKAWDDDNGAWDEYLATKQKKKEEILSWEDQIGYPKGVYDSFAEMIYGEYGEDSEQAVDLDKSFRNAVELNKKQ